MEPGGELTPGSGVGVVESVNHLQGDPNPCCRDEIGPNNNFIDATESGIFNSYEIFFNLILNNSCVIA
jgi:hypothetical protein